MVNKLHHSIRTGDLDQVRLLVEGGSSVESLDEATGQTPLMTACISPQAGPEIVLFLIGRGASVNASKKAKEAPNFAGLDDFFDDKESDPEIKKMLEMAKSFSANYTPDVPPMAVAVGKEISLEKLDLMLQAGMDPAARSNQGYTLAITAACGERMDLIRRLLDTGIKIDGRTSYGESVLSVLSSRGRFAEIKELLERGVDPGPLQWTALLRAAAIGDQGELARLVEAGADLEEKDHWERTPFLLSVHAGDIGKAALLLSKGAKGDAKGRCGKVAAHYAASRNEAAVLRWLIEQGFNIAAKDEFGHTPLREAAEAGAAESFRILLEADQAWGRTADERKDVIDCVSDPALVRVMLERGADLGEFREEAIRNFIGLGNAGDLIASETEYLAGRFPCFGITNPERMDQPFWKAMVRCGWSAYQGAAHFEDSSFGRSEPVWSHQRFGMSITPLPDGRFVQIAGEHEDHYDPDFYIYNDVFIHDGRGNFEILGYPREVFPPTDFHSATLVGEWIYIIGNLGYLDERRSGHTPVFRFHVESGKIETVPASGECPGWIHSHEAILEKAGTILISGGKVWEIDANGEQSLEKQSERYRFDPASGLWEKIAREV